MDHLTRSGAGFSTASQGVGDVELMTHTTLGRKGPHWWVGGLGLMLPTGSIDERDDVLSNPNQLLPYPMQLGSGSVRLVPMLNYIYQGPRWLSAFHAMARFSVEENSRGYEVGDQYHLSWVTVLKASDAFGLSLRLDGMTANNYSGSDADLNPSVVHTADPNRRGYDRATGLLGLNFYVTGGPFAGSRFLIEGGRPFYQNLDGPQLEVDTLFNLVWQWTF